jgi:hypothetical protein
MRQFILMRGGGVILQRYHDGGLADAKVFRLADGLTSTLGDRTRSETVRDWLGERAQARPVASERVLALREGRARPRTLSRKQMR